MSISSWAAGPSPAFGYSPLICNSLLFPKPATVLQTGILNLSTCQTLPFSMHDSDTQSIRFLSYIILDHFIHVHLFIVQSSITKIANKARNLYQSLHYCRFPCSNQVEIYQVYLCCTTGYICRLGDLIESSMHIRDDFNHNLQRRLSVESHGRLSKLPMPDPT